MGNYQIIAFITSFVIFMTYILWVWIKCGVQSSISESFYVIKGNAKWFFTLALWGFSLPLAIVGVELHPLFFWASVGIMFTGAAPAFRKDKGSNTIPSSKMQHNVHMVGAISGISLAVVGFLLVGIWAVSLIGVSIIGILYLLKVRNHIWWVEIVAYFMTLIGLILASSNIV